MILLTAEKIIALVFVVIAVILTFLTFFIMFAFRGHKIHSTQQKLILNTILQTQEKERIRIARELHDNVGDSLQNLKSEIEELIKIKFKDNQKEKIEKINTSFNNANAGLRSAIEDLNPFDKNNPNWIYELHKCYAKLEKCGVQVHNIVNGNVTDIGETSKLNLFRIVQELLNNTRKHAIAKEVYILYTYTDKDLEIDYRDDGIGFKVNALPQLNDELEGYGFHTIKSRVKNLNGNYKIISTPNNGSQWIFKFNYTNLI